MWREHAAARFSVSKAGSSKPTTAVQHILEPRVGGVLEAGMARQDASE
jgi:hypothetical protein